MKNDTHVLIKVIEDLKTSGYSKRQRTSLYLSEELYKKFRLACGEVPVSKAIERLMLIVVEESQKAG